MAAEIKPLEIYILTGLQRRIKEVLGLSCGYKVSLDPWMLPDGSRATNYPLSYLRFNSLTKRNEENNSVRGLDKEMVYGSSSTDANMVRAYQLLQVEMEIGFHFVTNSYDETLKIMNAWMFAWRHNSFNYMILYDGIEIDIKVQLDSDIVVPYQEQGLDEPTHYEFQGNIRIWGYLSQMTELQKNVVKTLNVSLFLPGGDTPVYSTESAWEDPAFSTQVLDTLISDTLIQQFMAADGEVPAQMADVAQLYGLKQVLADLSSRLHGNYPVPAQTGSTIVVDISHTSGVFTIVLTGNKTLSFTGGTSALDYRRFTLEVVQDSVGGWTLSYDSSVDVGADVLLTVSPTANITDYFNFVYRHDLLKSRLLSASHGYGDNGYGL